MEEISKVSITQKQIFEVVIDYRSQFPPTKSPDYDACMNKCGEVVNVMQDSADWLEFFKSSWMQFTRLKSRYKKKGTSVLLELAATEVKLFDAAVVVDDEDVVTSKKRNSEHYKRNLS